MTQTHRLPGGLINRQVELSFTFDGKTFVGHPGDTLASALLANGQQLLGRSFKYHRPRGIFSAGSEEPNALVQLRSGADTEPNTRATVAELFQGLVATSQHRRGSLRFDLLAVNDWLSPLLGAGFYYKTFMWPPAFWEKLYEPLIRAAAGLGRASTQPDPDHYDSGYLHCDLLVIGAGAAGLTAARYAAQAGLRVIVCDEDFRPGGRLNAESYCINDEPGARWAEQVAAELRDASNVRLLPRTTVFGAYDHGVYGAVQRCTDHLPDAGGKPRQIRWRIYARQSILCAGATERGVAFANNDRPGVMLAGAVRAYVNRWAVKPGHRITVLTNNDNGWRTARDLVDNGVVVPLVVDTRDTSAPVASSELPGTRIVMNGRIIDTRGRLGLRSVTLGTGESVDTDCLAVSGGWNPNVQLTSHQRTAPLWDDTIATFVPGQSLPPGMRVAGAAGGALSLKQAIHGARDAVQAVIETLGRTMPDLALPDCEDDTYNITPLWQVPSDRKRAWVDLQNDVTNHDIEQAWQEGYQSAELLKRYTTLGMATDQGKTANTLGLGVLAQVTNRSVSDTGTPQARPPYTPVAIGAMAGRTRGKQFRPTRLTPSHQWATENGAVFGEAGLWLRARWFAQPGETHWQTSVDREVTATRASVGVCDVTTLGKIDIQGRDAAQFLNRVYMNRFDNLAIGRVRYGLMLREDGFAMDDGTTARLGEHHYLMTTTTANAGAVLRHLEFCHQCLWPMLDVHLGSATEQYAQVAIAGPNSRALLAKLVDEPFDLSGEAFPFMACSDLTICGGTPARLFRISFSGELAYELAVPTRYGDSLMRVLMQAGKEFDVVAYGTEALGVMRIEKGHAAGNELNGQTTALHLGLARMAKPEADYIGRTLSQRPALQADNGLRLRGFIPVDRDKRLSAGSHFIAHGTPDNLEHDLGWMSSVAWSPTLGHSIGLGFIEDGINRTGQMVQAVNLLAKNTTDSRVDVRIVEPCFFDPDGGRQRG